MDVLNTGVGSLSTFLNSIFTTVGDWAPQLVGGIIALIIGLWIIRFLISLVGKALDKSKIDSTLRPFLLSIIGFALKLLLFVSIAGLVGIPTASFAALIAGVGIAIGAAFNGSLGHLASGIMLLIFRPFKLGDLIEVDGSLGFVKEISVFVTTIITFQNETVIIPNGTITAGKIKNLTEIGNLRCDIPFGIRYDADHEKATEIILNLLKNSPLVLQDPAPSVYVTNLGENGIEMVALPYSLTGNYWDVFWGMRGQIKKALSDAGFEAPLPQRLITNLS